MNANSQTMHHPALPIPVLENHPWVGFLATAFGATQFDWHVFFDGWLDTCIKVLSFVLLMLTVYAQGMTIRKKHRQLKHGNGHGSGGQ